MADFTVEQRDPRDLSPNPLNWRRHPQTQREVLAYSLDKFGFVQGVVLNSRTGNLIDGHARVEEAIEQGRETIPVNVVDMSEEDERELLRLFDPVGALADTDSEALDRLIAEIGNPDLEAMLSGVSTVDYLVPDPTERTEPMLPGEVLIEVYCSRRDLPDLRPVLEEWQARDGITVHVS